MAMRLFTETAYNLAKRIHTNSMFIMGKRFLLVRCRLLWVLQLSDETSTI